MGGRGAASGMSVSGNKYGTEYLTIHRSDNIKYLKRNVGKANLPLETMAGDQNRVYASINDKNKIQAIGFYNKNGDKRRQIDLLHTHGGEVPHVHSGYYHPDDTVRLTKSDKAYIKKVTRIWNQREAQK